MKPFTYTRAKTVADALAALATRPQTQLLAGGTNLVDLMKYDLARPEAIIDIMPFP